MKKFLNSIILFILQVIERFIMGADHGVIFFSLGSTFNTEVPDPGYIEGFIQMLGRGEKNINNLRDT